MLFTRARQIWNSPHRVAGHTHSSHRHRDRVQRPPVKRHDKNMESIFQYLQVQTISNIYIPILSERLRPICISRITHVHHVSTKHQGLTADGRPSRTGRNAKYKTRRYARGPRDRSEPDQYLVRTKYLRGHPTNLQYQYLEGPFCDDLGSLHESITHDCTKTLP